MYFWKQWLVIPQHKCPVVFVTLSTVIPTILFSYSSQTILGWTATVRPSWYGVNVLNNPKSDKGGTLVVSKNHPKSTLVNYKNNNKSKDEVMNEKSNLPAALQLVNILVSGHIQEVILQWVCWLYSQLRQCLRIWFRIYT